MATKPLENSIRDFGFSQVGYEGFCVAIFAQSLSLSPKFQERFLRLIGFGKDVYIDSIRCEKPIPNMPRRPDVWLTLKDSAKKTILVLIEGKTVSKETNNQMADYRRFLNQCLENGEVDQTKLVFLASFKFQELSEEPDVRLSWNNLVDILPIKSRNEFEKSFIDQVRNHLLDTCCVPEPKGTEEDFIIMLKGLCVNRPYILFQNEPHHKQMRLEVNRNDPWVKLRMGKRDRQNHLFVIDKASSSGGILQLNSVATIWPKEWIKETETVDRLISQAKRYHRNYEDLGYAINAFLDLVDIERGK